MANYFFNSDVEEGIDGFVAPAFDKKQLAQTALSVNADDNRTVLENVGLFVPAVLAKTIDTFVGSLPGVSEDYVDEVLANNFPTLADYIEDNPNAVGITSDILGSIVPAGIAIKAMRTGSVLNKVAIKTFGDGANRFFSTGLPNARLFRPEFRQARRLLRSRPGLQDISNIVTPEFAGMKRKAIATSVKDVLIESVAADAAIFATMNSSDFLFPEEMTLMDHLVFFGASNTVFGAVAGMHAKYVMSRGVNELVRRVKARTSNPLQVLAQVSSTADNRGAAIVSWQLMAHQFRDIVENASDVLDNEGISIAKANTTAAQTRLADNFTNAASDSTIKNVTSAFKLEGAELATLQFVAEQKTNMGAFDGLRSLERFDSTFPWELNLKRRISEDKLRLQHLKETLEKAGNQDKIASVEADIKPLEAAIKDNEQTSVFVYELDGTMSGTTARKDMFQDGAREIISNRDGSKILNVDGIEIKVNKHGGIELPSTVVSLKPKASTAFAVAPSVVMKSLKMSEKQLAKQLRQLGGTAGISVTPELQRLRNSVPETFTVFMKNGEDSVMSLVKNKEYKTPFTISRNDIFGLREDYKLLGSVPAKTAMNSDTFTQLSFKQMTAVHDAQQAAREAVNIDTLEELPVLAGMHHTQLDLVSELLMDKKIGQQVAAKIKTDIISQRPDIDFNELVQWHSLRSKFNDFQLIQDRRIASNGLDDLTAVDYARMLNLPTTDDRIIQLFQATRVNKTHLDLHDVFETPKAFKETLKTLTDLPEFDESIQLIGSMQKLSRDKKPVVGLLRTTDMPDGVISRSSLEEKIAADRAALIDTMLNGAKPDANGFASRIVSKVAKIAEQQSGLLASIKRDAATLTGGTEAGGKISKVLGTQMFNARMQSVTQAMSRFTELTDKAVQREVIENEIIQVAKPHFQALMKRGNEGDFASFAQGFNALRGGWFVKREIKTHIQHPGTMGSAGLPGRKNIQFYLEQNSANKALWRERFGTEMPANALLPISKTDKTPVTVTELGYNGLKAVDGIQQQILTEENLLLKAQNKPGIARKAWHMPVPNLANKSVVYLMDISDQIVQAVVGNTPAEAKVLASRAAKQYKKEVHIIGEDAIAAHARAKGRAFQDLTDLSTPSKQTAASKGALASPIITTDPRELNAIIDDMIAEMANLGRRARIQLVKPELDLAEFQKLASTIGKDVQKTLTDTVWDAFKNAALGVQKIDDNSVIGKSLLALENGYDKVMQRFYDFRYGNKTTPNRLEQKIAEKQWKDFNDKIIPEFNPFKDFNDYVERTAQISLPQTLRRNAGALNEITTALSIRIFDVGMGVINTLSLAVTLPPVISALARQTGESSVEHLKRIGAYADVTPGGIAKLNPIKTITSATHWMWNSEEAQAIRIAAERKGFFDQFAAEQVKLYGRTGEDFVSGLLRNFADKTSKITDKTETFARAYSFMNFAFIGKKILGLNDEAASAFAHFQANNVIADFRPSNRPLMFQGAAGMPIGLFTTYMWNYLQRMYSMVESKQMKALVSQVGLQASFFGAESVPGVQGFIETFTSNYDGSSNLVDRLNEKLGHEVTSWIMNGSVASITGVSFGPRASVGIPGTRFNPLETNFYLESAPSFSMMKKAITAFGQSFDNTISQGGFDPRYAAQLWARMNINKGSANAIELAQGFSEDIKGHMIEDDTRTGVGIASRILGMKPLYADEFRQEHRRNTAVDAKRNELKDRLGETLRQHARKGTLTSEVVEDALADYVKAGGNPENFRRFYKQQVVKGTQSLIELDIAEALKTSHDEKRIARLLNIMEL